MQYYISPVYDKDAVVKLKLEDFSGAFYLLGIGLTVSFVVFVAEIMVYRKKEKQHGLRTQNRLEQQPTYRENDESHAYQQRLQQLQQRRDRQFQHLQKFIAHKFQKPVNVVNAPFGGYQP